MKKIVQNYVNAYNKFDIVGMTKDIHNDVEFENITNGQVDLILQGIEQFRKQAESAKEYFKERKQIITRWEFQDNVITINVAYDAILAIDLPNGMAAGDLLQLKGQSIFEFKEGQIIKIQDKS
ncbi:nuclear transport factor 2 family protein [Aquimarina sp. AU474]|uniref:nuclear transport factor 2 family protein n=1 Tax=Aquimarina sp. AU474 TaxID=2108529 RepID=UPI00135B3D45|nr:nuclear transport factor 2 family protein [Aquimarina sp. AU474]